MNNYNFTDDGWFTAVTQARINPRATAAAGFDIYLLPRNATHTPVPDELLEDGYNWRWDGNQWQSALVPVPEPIVPLEDVEEQESDEEATDE